MYINKTLNRYSFIIVVVGITIYYCFIVQSVIMFYWEKRDHNYC